MLDILAVAAHGAEGGELHVENTALGFLTPGMVVALAMIVVLLIMWRAGVPRIIAGVLDGRITEIRKQLDEAKQLRAEAASLKDRYEKQVREADKEIAALRTHAEDEAGQIIERAEKDAAELISRRRRMAEEKIAAAERTAVAEMQATAAKLAAEAAQGLIRQNHSADADKVLVNQAIGSI